jgi:hypothetical protein
MAGARKGRPYDRGLLIGIFNGGRGQAPLYDWMLPVQTVGAEVEPECYPQRLRVTRSAHPRATRR